MIENYALDNHDIKIEIKIKPNNRNVYMRIKNGIILLTTPKKLTDKYISEILSKNKRRIINAVATYNDNLDKIKFLGLSYDKVVIESENDSIDITDNAFIIRTKSSDETYILRLIHNFYSKKIKEISMPIIKEAELVFSDSIVVKPNYSFSYLKSCYGRYIIKKNIIEISGLSAKLDIDLIRYVIYHEFAHIKYRNHQKEFYDYLKTKMPNYAIYFKKLRSVDKKTKNNWFLGKMLYN